VSPDPGPCIVTCAITGSIHTPSMSPFLPVTGAEIAAQAIAAAEAGAAILHLHARDPANGRPSADLDHWMGFLPAIAKWLRRDPEPLDRRLGGDDARPAPRRRPARRARDVLAQHGHDELRALPDGGEAPRVEARLGTALPAVHRRPDLQEHPARHRPYPAGLGRERGARFEFECYDIGHLDMLRHFVDRGMVEPPFFIQFVFGVLGGMAAEPQALQYLKGKADRLFGTDYLFSVLGAGRSQMEMASASLMLGGHARVGLEDNLYLERGRLARSNAEQVLKLRTLLDTLGRPRATPAEARVLLGLKGAAGTAL
jgi:uncharacterized protein (DUF849 family)